MIWNLKRGSGICWARLKKPCAQLDRFEGRDISCMRCMVVKDFLKDPCEIKLDSHAHESVEEFVAFLIRVANADSRRL